MEKLPKLYTNKINKKIDNSLEYVKINKEYIKKDEYSILKEIDNIFKSKEYIYKIKVLIKTKDKELNKKIIGRTKNYLITIDNELINIKDIIEIKKLA